MKRGRGRPVIHEGPRISSTVRFKQHHHAFLKMASFLKDTSITGILEAAIDEWMTKHEQELRTLQKKKLSLGQWP